MRAIIRCAPALSAAAFVLAACALTSNFTPPRLSVVDVQIQSSDLWEQRLKVRNARAEPQ